jgi:hypothetical protein
VLRGTPQLRKHSVKKKKIAEIIENVQNEFYYRLGYCQDVQGQHFEHLLPFKIKVFFIF